LKNKKFKVVQVCSRFKMVQGSRLFKVQNGSRFKVVQGSRLFKVQGCSRLLNNITFEN